MSVCFAEDGGIERYLARYRGHTKKIILLFIAQRVVEQRKIRLLKMAYNEESEDVRFLASVIHAMNKNEPDDAECYKLVAVSRVNKEKTGSLEREVLLQKESLVAAYNKLAEHYFATSYLKYALECYELITQSGISRENMFQACMNCALVSMGIQEMNEDISHSIDLLLLPSISSFKMLRFKVCKSSGNK